MRRLGLFALGTRTVEVVAGRDAVWALVRRGSDGGLAVRAAHGWAGPMSVRRKQRRAGEALRLEVRGVAGVQTVTFATGDNGLPSLRIAATLDPAEPLLVAPLSRDLYPLGPGDDPLAAEGRVEAAQRGMNSGITYFHIDRPDFGSVLYFQNLTALNDYFRATRTKPDGAVGGEWPEIGYLPPTPPQSGTPPVDPLAAGRPVAISDAILVFHDDIARDEQALARRFIQMLGAAYRLIDAPATEYRDWVARADRTLRDLQRAPEATTRHYGHTYIHPYTASEHPDVMVQSSILSALRDYEAWTGAPIPFAKTLEAGLGKFHDAKRQTMRRYLPDVGKDKDADAIDSWYLYHPLKNIGRLALDGDGHARRLFLDSLPFAIAAARHFKYAWPIQYKIDTFEVIDAARNDDGLGQTDVGGLYAYVMLQAYDLTEDPKFVTEARKAIDAAKGMRFELNYQANLTAWGAAACMRLWRITDREYYLDQAYVYLASFLHNAAIWESEIDHAAGYKVFLGVTALHDAPYMAIYECFDSFAAFERFLESSGPDLDPAARLLVSQYCRYALDRAWYYYPDTLPPDALAQNDIRNGHIDRKLSFPVEDLYVDGQPAGQVGQEIYGAGAAFVFASRSFHNVEGAPFRLFCDHFPVTSERTSERSLSFGIQGGEDRSAAFALVRLPRKRLPKVTLRTTGGETLRPVHRSPDRIEYAIPAIGEVSLNW